MTKDTLKKLVCRFVYKSKYNPENAMKVDWDKLVYDYEHEPDITVEYLKNESRVNFYKQELVLVENKINFLEGTLQELQTKHEQWGIENDVLYRYRDNASIERTKMLEGPNGQSIEEWAGYFYNSLIEY